MKFIIMLQRFDRTWRRAVAVRRGQVWCTLASWTAPCSGCAEGIDASRYDLRSGAPKGPGCRECGFTGKRRHRVWVPLCLPDQIALNVRLRVRKAHAAAEQRRTRLAA